MKLSSSAVVGLCLCLGFSLACGPSGSSIVDGDQTDSGLGNEPIDKVDGSVPVSEEICDQLDNNQDGNVDEHCSCELNATQPCWLEDPSRRGVGVCADGMQTCGGEDEFASWGACNGGTTPSPEGDSTSCQNTLDDDCDGLTDCDDTDCVNVPACCDTKCVVGTVRWCDEPEYCTWGNQTCGPDGAWSDCTEVGAPDGCDGILDGFFYDEDCCVENGYCCEHPFDHSSVGNCPPEEQVCGL